MQAQLTLPLETPPSADWPDGIPPSLWSPGALAAHKLGLPLEPPVAEAATIGGGCGARGTREAARYRGCSVCATPMPPDVRFGPDPPAWYCVPNDSPTHYARSERFICPDCPRPGV